MNKTMMSNAPRRRAKRPKENTVKPKQEKPELLVDIDRCYFVTVVDKAATQIRKQMRTKAKTSKIIFICESIAEANIIYSLALNRSDFGYVYVCLERPQQFHLTKYAAGVMTYIVGRYHVCLVDKNSSGWTSWYQKKP